MDLASPAASGTSVYANGLILSGFPSGLVPLGFPTKTLYTPLLSTIRATCHAHLVLLDLIIRIILG